MFDHLIPLYRLEKLYTLFYDEKDGEIYKIKHRKESDFGALLSALVVVLFMNLLNEFYVAQATLILNITILFVSLALTFWLTKKYIEKQYQSETKETSYLYKDQVKKEAKSGLKQFQVECIWTIISIPIILISAYFFLKNAQTSLLVLADTFFAIMLTFLFKKPVRRKELLEKINE